MDQSDITTAVLPYRDDLLFCQRTDRHAGYRCAAPTASMNNTFLFISALEFGQSDEPLCHQIIGRGTENMQNAFATVSRQIPQGYVVSTAQSGSFQSARGCHCWRS